jgi:predicted PurR-regulated permease PerM
MKTTPAETTSYLLIAALLLGVLHWHLLPALMAGMLVYQLAHLMSPRLQRWFFNERAKLAAVLLLALVVTCAFLGAVFGAFAFFRSEGGGLPVLFHKMAQILDDARRLLPGALIDSLPEDADALRQAATAWLHTHAAQVQLAGKEIGRALAHVLIGLIIGALVVLHEARPDRTHKPLARALVARLALFSDIFRRVVFAQVRISALNTALTAVYLLAILPACGIHLPLLPTLLAVTFLAGLFPVIGNLISNSVIVVVSLAHSLAAAIASLVFLVVIHKLEYFANARIIGSQLRASAWELLLAMLVMETLFGLPGVVAAPIFYAYLKTELAQHDLV